MIASFVERVVLSERATILGSLLRLCRDLDLAEEALQEAAVRALQRWPVDGLPERPGAWLTVVARRWVIDHMRAARRTTELALETMAAEPERDDDRLRLLFACCDTELSERARVCLALRSLLGLTTREIARALLESEATTAQRLVRAKRTLMARPPGAELPRGEAREAAIDGVLRTLYLMFNEGYLATEGPRLARERLMADAILIAEQVTELFPFHAEALGLAALMWFTAARAASRTDAMGDLVPLEEQDRARWNAERITRGEALIARFMTVHQEQAAAIGPYQLQAAIASLHCEAKRAADTDWLQIAALYRRLVEVSPSPIAELNAAVALAMSGDIEGGLAWVNALERRGQLDGYHLLAAVKAGLLERAGHRTQARRYYGRARRLASNERERRFLSTRIEALDTSLG